MEKVWLEHYQQNVPKEIDLNEHTSVVSLFEDSCFNHKNNVAYINFGTKLTYHELERKSYWFACYLQRLELQKKARVAIMMPNLLQYPIALFGTLRAGYIVVNTNPLYTAEELIYQMNDCQAEVIVVLANFAHIVEKSLPRLPFLKHIIITQIGDIFPFIKRTAMNALIKLVKKKGPSYSLPQAIAFNQALKDGQAIRLHHPRLSHQDIAFLQYTGGTTGVAKGAILTHGNMIANVLQAWSWIASLKIDASDCIVTALPLYHIFSLTANCLIFLKAGAQNILITNPRELNHFVSTLKKSKFTVITGVNTLFNALLNHPKFKEVDFSHLKLTLSGGMALQKSVAERWQEITKMPVLEAYGLTETSPAVTINPVTLKKYNGSIGLPLPSTEISIRNDQGEEVGFETPGELCVKGPQVMKEYWQQQTETRAVFTVDGFLKTGDIVYVDKNGFIYLIDRKKDMIVVSGFNVYPNEIEQVISLHPGVLEVGIIGIPDNESGERAKACIVKRDPNLTSEQIITHCRNYLTPYKVPKVVEFFSELPKTNVGKILRRDLKVSA